MYGRLQEEVTWTRLLDMQREAENRRLPGGTAGAAQVGPSQWFGGLITRMARLAFRRPVDGAGALRERRDAVRRVA